MKNKYFVGVNILYQGRQLTLNAFKSGEFSLKASQGKGLKQINS